MQITRMKRHHPSKKAANFNIEKLSKQIEVGVFIEKIRGSEVVERKGRLILIGRPHVESLIACF